jgi:hypothetical protein
LTIHVEENGGCGGEGDGGGGKAHVTMISSTAASPVKLVPRTYSKAKLVEPTATLAGIQLLPLLPLLLHNTPFVASIRRSVPIVAPYM